MYSEQRNFSVISVIALVCLAAIVFMAPEHQASAYASVPEQKTNDQQKPVVAIDPGHQSRQDLRLERMDPDKRTRKAKISSGCTGVASGMPEYKYTLIIAKKLKKELIKRGYGVYMTRTKNNVRISNKKRSLRVNKSGAAVYIRLHCDSYGYSNRGVSMQYKNKRNSYVSRKTVRRNKKLSKAILSKYCKATKLKNRGITGRNDLTGSNWSKIPTTLIEMGFFSNPKEDRKMQKKSFQKKMVKGIADGIDAYFR